MEQEQKRLNRLVPSLGGLILLVLAAAIIALTYVLEQSGGKAGVTEVLIILSGMVAMAGATHLVD